jgi:ketosteroid isomerase-like protein
MAEEEAVLAAVRRFYRALEDLLTGKGIEAMREAWHHTPRVTSAHPLGDWSRGWEEVEATWSTFIQIGRPEMAGSEVTELHAFVYGDVAYTTCVFVTAPFAGKIKLNCTNVLHRADGAWKIVHHHADKSPGLETALEHAATS